MGILTKSLLAANLGICIAMFSSCLDDNQPETLYPTLGTVQNEGKLTIDSDSYGKLIPTNPNKLTVADLDEEGQRVMVSVPANEIDAPASAEEEEGKKVEIVELYKVTTKDADRTDKEEEEIRKEFGNDPVQITSATISKKHLNIQYRLKGTDRDSRHRISLVLTPDSKIDEEGFLQVELRHNAGGDNPIYDFWSVTSFQLASIPGFQPETKGFKITYNSGSDAKAEWKVTRGKNDRLTKIQ